jgi:epoxyqueuosine reductase
MNNKNIMEKGDSSKTNSRRDFIRTVAIVTPAFFLNFREILAMNSSKPLFEGGPFSPNIEYKYQTFSVNHIDEVKNWFDKLKRENKISDNKTFRSYIDNFIFNPQEVMKGAKSLIILSLPQKTLSILFNYKNEKYEILIPSGYSDDGVKFTDLKDQVMKEIVKDPTKRIEEKVRLPLKTLSVRSGLAEYGKNNITYVDGYGSYHQLIGFYTDKELEDNWGPLKTLRECNGCTICVKKCPTNCFREDNFVIDIGKCISLYNELPDPIPEWMSPHVHNTIVGCLKCQWDCPANIEANKRFERIAEISNEETEFILSVGKDEAMKKTIIDKLSSKFPYINDMGYVSRNLRLVLESGNAI